MRISSAGRQNAHSPSAGSSHKQSSRSSASASFSGARSQHPNVPGLRVDALLAHSAPPAPAVTSFERERATPRPQKARAAAKQADDDVRSTGRPGSADGRVGGDLGGQAQAYAYPTRRGTKPGAHRTPQLDTARAGINRATPLRAAPLPFPVEPDAIPPLYVGRNIVPIRPPPESPARAGSRGRRSERHSICRRQRQRFGPERDRWTRRQGRHQSRLRDTRASMGGARLPKKDGSRTEWNRP